MLAGGAGIPSDLAAYQLEPKFDGQRILVTADRGIVRLTNRAGRDATSVYPELAALGPALGEDCVVVLDGEVVATDAAGQPSFQRLQHRMHVADPSHRLQTDVPVIFAAFDVLWFDGELVTARPQHERRAILETLQLRGPAWQTAPILDASPDELLAACSDLGLEGFMAKRLDAAYLPGRRSPAWRKIKCGRRREFVVGGWSPGKGWRASTIGSLALGCYGTSPDSGLLYVGQVGSGLTEEIIAALRQLFDKTARPTTPFARPLAPRGVNFVEPVLVVEVAYAGVTDSGTLRQPSFKGLRTNLDPAEITADEEIASRDAEYKRGPPW